MQNSWCVVERDFWSQHYAYSALLICITSNVQGGRAWERTGNEDKWLMKGGRGGFQWGYFEKQLCISVSKGMSTVSEEGLALLFQMSCFCHFFHKLVYLKLFRYIRFNIQPFLDRNKPTVFNGIFLFIVPLWAKICDVFENLYDILK